MANDCYYEMKVTGTKKSIDEFVRTLQCCYNYKSRTFTANKHFYRVSEVYVDDYVKQPNSPFYSTVIHGYCAWSITSCMMDDGYYETYHKFFKSPKDTTLRQASKQLHLAIDAFSSEPGFCFQEHIKFLNGKCLVNACVDYYEASIDNEKDLDDFNKAVNGSFMMKDVHDGWLNTATFDSSSLEYQVKPLLNVYKKLRSKWR